MFEIDTGNAFAPKRGPQSPDLAGYGEIRWAGAPVKAERFHRHLIRDLRAARSTDELSAIMHAKSLMIDALWLDFPEYAELVDAAEREARALLDAAQSARAETPRPADPVNPTAQHGKDGKDDKDGFFF